MTRSSQLSPLVLVCLALAALAALEVEGPTAVSDSLPIGEATAADLGALRELALGDADPAVVGKALAAMGRLQALAGDEQVAALLQDPRPRVRQDYVLALGLAADPLAIPRLQRIASGADAELRPLALQSLGGQGPAAAPVLAELQARQGWNETEQACLREALARVSQGPR